MKETLVTYSLEDIGEIVSHYLLPLLIAGRIITFTGHLGAGKTTLIKEICRQLGVKDEVKSPTFTYVNTYIASEGVSIHHFDLYRIEDSAQFFDAGFDEYLRDEEGVCLIEWPAAIAPLLAEHYRAQTSDLVLSYVPEEVDKRKLTLYVP